MQPSYAYEVNCAIISNFPIQLVHQTIFKMEIINNNEATAVVVRDLHILGVLSEFEGKTYSAEISVVRVERIIPRKKMLFRIILAPILRIISVEWSKPVTIITEPSQIIRTKRLISFRCDTSSKFTDKFNCGRSGCGSSRLYCLSTIRQIDYLRELIVGDGSSHSCHHGAH